MSNFSFQELSVLRSRGFGQRRVKVATDGEVTRMSLPLVFAVSPKPLWLIRPATPAPERAGP